jgi:AraC-like DNA-binding protein
VLAGVADLIESYGQNPDQVARSAGVNPELLYRPDLPLPALAYNALMEAAALACDDQFLLLRLAEVQSWRLIGPIDALVKRAVTVREMLELLAQYTEQHSQGLYVYLDCDESGASLCFEVRAFTTFDPQQRKGQLHNVDLGMALSCFELRRQLGKEWRPQYVQFQHNAPEALSRMRQVFGEKLHFNQDINSLRLSNTDLNQPFDDNKVGSELAIPSGASVEVGLNIPLILRVDRAIRLLLNRCECSAEQVATALNLKLRTLQHQLKQEQTSYQLLYDAVRLDMARSYLAESKLSIGAISERLQFNDSAAFSNFFKQGAGCTPRAYRNNLREIDEQAGAD